MPLDAPRTLPETPSMRRRTLLASLAVATLILAALSPSPAADEKSGFTPLFNGRDFTGWKIFLQRNADNVQTKTFTVERGEIHCTGQPMGYMLTDKEYGDYVLRVQWRFPDKPGNSGVFVHVSGPDTIWPRGVEAQLMSGRAGDIWRVGPNGDEFKLTVAGEKDPRSTRHHVRIGDKYVMKEGKDAKGRPQYDLVSKKVEKDIGEWNQCEITCKGDTIALVVNGEKVNEGTHAESTKGKILLQSEGAPIVFRNVEIKSLK
jgi:hypothetical protein